MIAEEYAKALFGLSANDKLKDIDDDLHIICQALDENPDAIKVLTYPNISINNKKEYFFGPVFLTKKDNLFREYYTREVVSRRILIKMLPNN